MDIPDLVHALLAGDLLTARQWVADAQRKNVRWEQLDQPRGLSDREMSVAAGIVELLASRSGSLPPTWTKTIGAVREPLILDPGLEEMRVVRAREDGRPESLRDGTYRVAGLLAWRNPRAFFSSRRSHDSVTILQRRKGSSQNLYEHRHAMVATLPPT